MSLQLPNTFDADRKKFLLKLQQVQNRLQTDQGLTEAEVINEIFRAYREVYETIEEPDKVNIPLDPFDVRDTETLNEPFEAAQRNSDFLLSMHTELQQAELSTFNYLAALSEMVTDLVNRGSTRSLDLKTLTGTLDRGFVVAGDDFYDASRIDFTNTVGIPAEVVPLGGAVSLKRVQATDILAEQEAEITINGPAALYEGKKFGVFSPSVNVQADGNSFKFENIHGSYGQERVEGLSPDLRNRYQAIQAYFRANPTKAKSAGFQNGVNPKIGLKNAKKEGTYAGLTTDEWEQIAGNYHFERPFLEDSVTLEELGAGGKYDDTLSSTERDIDPFRFKTVVVKSPPEEVQLNRQRMIDGDPDSYWQGELVIDTSDEFNYYQLDDSSNEAVPDVDFTELTNIVQNRFDTESQSLELDIILDLKRPRILNFLSLLPVHFHASQVPEIVSISHSFDGTVFHPITEALNNGFETKITEDVNSELTEDEVALSMAADKFAYNGQALFAFEPMEAQFLRVRLRERVPVPVLYQTLRMILQRTTTVKKKKKLFGKTKRSVSTSYNSRTLDFDYTQSLQVVVNEIDSEAFRERAASAREDVVGISRDFGLSGGFFAFSQDPIALASIAGPNSEMLSKFLKNNLSSPIGTVASKVFGERRTVTHSDWEVTNTVFVPKYNKARYAIGVRELRLFSYSYAQTSDLVSTPFFTPKPITQVSLEVDEVIPRSLSGEDFLPIRYFFSLDDGNTWSEIAPLRSRLRIVGANQVPQVYHINSELPADQRDDNVGFVDTTGIARTVRFRASLFRQTAADVSPILKSYRLRLRMEGGL